MRTRSFLALVLLCACGDDDSPPRDASLGVLRDTGLDETLDGAEAPRLSDGFRAMLANPVAEDLREGEWLFYNHTWDIEATGGLPAQFYVDLWQSDVTFWGEQFSNFGFLIDPEDDLPIGLKRSASNPELAGQTCAICHVARLDDGRVWTGFPAVALRRNAWLVAIDDAWVEAGNASTLSPIRRERFALYPQAGIQPVANDAAPNGAPVDLPFYLNFGRRARFGSDGNAQDARSAILVSIFGFRDALNPEPFPGRAITDPFVEFLTSIETPLPLTPPPADDVARGREVFDEAQCSACHNPDMQTEEQVIEWVAEGPELLPGEDPEHPNGTIATDGERFLMTGFNGGVDMRREAFILFIFSEGLRVGATNGYIPRDIHAAFASAPYLHNGSVPTLEALLTPASERPSTFDVRGVTVDTSVVGMSNAGHEFGTELGDEDKQALIAYLNSL